MSADHVGMEAHWNRVYTEKGSSELSWYQVVPTRSLELIRHAGAKTRASIIDVGGGDSTLVDELLILGFTNITVLDLSSAALGKSKARLGDGARSVTWLAANVLDVELPAASVDVWHDRAVFHFLNAAAERDAYIQKVRRVVRPGGHVIVATFAEDGPTSCSGLPVQRYSAAGLHSTFGEGFRLIGSEREMHHTPSGRDQPFVYCWCRHDSAGL
jgi:ubiquinone/menaquinone biosynthesis C-methylase UbiE